MGIRYIRRQNFDNLKKMSRFSYFYTSSGDWSTNKSCAKKAPQHRKEWGRSGREPLQRQRQLCAGDQEGQVVLHLQTEVRCHQVLCWLRYLQQLVPRKLRQHNAKDVEKDVRVSHARSFVSQCRKSHCSVCRYVCDECRSAKENDEIYCLCRQPYDESQFYIGCERCSDWFHGRCVGILQAEAKDIDE